MIRKLAYDSLSWLPWLVIPLLVEFIPAIGNFIILIKKKIHPKREKYKLKVFPDITIMVPVYNSADSLRACLKSINDSTYPNKNIEVILIDNKKDDATKDNSFEIFTECQIEFPTLSLQWTKSEQGKSRALNMALYNASGKYIINIDSDGLLEKNALYNTIAAFESDIDVDCMTGVILTNADMIGGTGSITLDVFQNIEYMEYVQAFLAGRNFDSEYDNIFTLSGAFSAFRKSTVLNTRLYNTDTICEDTELSFQVKEILGKNVLLCEDAVFIVDPIESMNKLYTQRQRWQTGELEVFHMFYDEKKLSLKNIMKDKNLRTLFYDHTFAFPRLVWYFGLIVTALCDYYNPKTIAIASTLLYVACLVTHYLYFITNILFLSEFKDIRKEYVKRAPYIILLPLYNTLIFFYRIAGIINPLTRAASWKTYSFKEELNMVKEQIRSDLSFDWLRKKE